MVRAFDLAIKETALAQVGGGVGADVAEGDKFAPGAGDDGAGGA